MGQMDSIFSHIHVPQKSSLFPESTTDLHRFPVVILPYPRYYMNNDGLMDRETARVSPTRQ